MCYIINITLIFFLLLTNALAKTEALKEKTVLGKINLGHPVLKLLAKFQIPQNFQLTQ